MVFQYHTSYSRYIWTGCRGLLEFCDSGIITGRYGCRCWWQYARRFSCLPGYVSAAPQLPQLLRCSTLLTDKSRFCSGNSSISAHDSVHLVVRWATRLGSRRMAVDSQLLVSTRFYGSLYSLREHGLEVPLVHAGRNDAPPMGYQIFRFPS